MFPKGAIVNIAPIVLARNKEVIFICDMFRKFFFLDVGFLVSRSKVYRMVGFQGKL